MTQWQHYDGYHDPHAHAKRAETLRHYVGCGSLLRSITNRAFHPSPRLLSAPASPQNATATSFEMLGILRPWKL